jgi:LuxR family transcriptional regulator, maltose regulon positive regulatory protein
MLATKLYRPPPRPSAVPRPHLIARLDQGLSRKLTLLAAPAGYGKTSLVSQWLTRIGNSELRIEKAEQAADHSLFSIPHSLFKAAWLSLDEGDNDPIRFLTYLVAALQTARADLGGEAMAALQSPQPPPVEAILTALLNAISDSPSPLILVLDDYHVIDSGPVDRLLAFLVAHLPPQLHLVIVTRDDPALPLAQLRARGQLSELRAADLRFSPAEAAAFFSQAMDLNLAESDIATLVARTEGWVAGLQLAGLSLQGQHDRAGFIRSFTGSHRFVIDYLVQEVLDQQPEALQRFLLQTAILDRLCGPLCDAVLGIENSELRIEKAVENDLSLFSILNSQLVLQHLERANLFIVPLDDERRWYRYHHLFADVLRQRLHQRAAAPPVAELHQRASRWYAEHDLINDAFQHAVAAEDLARAADLAELAWPAMFRNSFQNTIFLGWMRALPDDLIRAHPVLSAGYAWALLDIGELDAADMRLRDAERWLDAHPAEPTALAGADEATLRMLPATIALARAHHASTSDDRPATVIHARRVLALLPETDLFERAGAFALLGAASLRGGNLDEAAAAFADGLALIHTLGNIAFELSGIPPLAGIRIAQGRLHEASRIYARALRLAPEPGTPPLEGIADLYAGLSEICLAQGDQEAAREHLRHSEELGARAGLPNWPSRVRLAQARLAEADGEPDRALALLDEAERRSYPSPLPDLQPVAALKARVWIRQGQLAEARQWARERGLSANDEPVYMREYEHLTLARLLIVEARTGQRADTLRTATHLLGRLLAAAETGGRTGSEIEILMLQALAAAAGGGLPAALDRLGRALALAEPEGYIRLFVDEGPPMRQLLTTLQPEAEALRAYVETLLTAFPAQPDLHPSSFIPHLHEPLTQRELEVLHLVAQGLSNREIGARLCLAESTVKGHNLTIFSKLQVQRRTEAIARARELGLL